MEHKLLNIMLEDMKSVPSLYRPTRFWQSGLEEIERDIRQLGVENFRSHQSALKFFVPTYAFPGLIHSHEVILKLEKYIDTLLGIGEKGRLLLRHLLLGESQALADYRVYLASSKEAPPYTDTFSESCIGSPVEQFEFDGRRFSRSSLNYLLGLNYLKSCVEIEKLSVVLEIGGGFGSLGEILLSDPRNSCLYINIDIPPTSYIATYYLKKLFGEDMVGDYASVRHANSIDIQQMAKRYRAIVLCPWLLPRLVGSVDLFVNFISFQEMEPEVVKNYLRHVTDLKTSFVLLRNLREGKQKAEKGGIGVKEPVIGADYDRFLSDYLLVGTNTIPFGFKTVDGFHSELRVYKRKN